MRLWLAVTISGWLRALNPGSVCVFGSAASEQNKNVQLAQSKKGAQGTGVITPNSRLRLVLINWKLPNLNGKDHLQTSTHRQNIGCVFKLYAFEVYVGLVELATDALYASPFQKI